METNVEVTVGLCVKNSEATVERAVNSLIAQDYPHELTELLIVDGFSCDKTIQIIKESLLNVDIKKRFFCENHGLGKARQTVIENALGRYVIWLDGDMEFPRDFVRKQVEFMDANPFVGIGKGKYGLNKEDNLAAALENMEFVINFSNEGETDSKSLGTAGCIYRVQAIREAGGFNENFKGVGEDMDAEYRIRKQGWKLYVTNAVFYEKHRDTWRALWNEYFWHGYGGYRLFKSDNKLIDYYKMFPPVAMLFELSRARCAYRLTNKKDVFLLPLHYFFKRIAWVMGFMKGEFNGY
jgi:glycosyltransferase involved in cell wall biosynthesis